MIRKKHYIVRAQDQGNMDKFCPRCEINKRKTALTKDRLGYIHCAGCGWEKCWSEDGLPITV